jgi:hypothetical protein
MLVLKQILIVALGGAVGSVARYKIGGFALHHTQAWDFPLSTFCVNALGCFIIGVLAALVEHHDLFSASAVVSLYPPAWRFHNFLGVRLRKCISSTARSASSNGRIRITQHCVRSCCGVRWNKAGGPLLATAPLTPEFRRKRGDRNRRLATLLRIDIQFPTRF